MWTTTKLLRNINMQPIHAAKNNNLQKMKTYVTGGVDEYKRNEVHKLK